MLTGRNPNPEGPSEVCDLAPGAGGQASWLDGSGFQSPPTDGRTLARIPEPWFFHLERGRFYHETRSQVWVIKNPLPRSRRPQVLATAGLTCYRCSPSTRPPPLCTHCPASRRCFIIQSASEGSPRPATALLHCSLSPWTWVPYADA